MVSQPKKTGTCVYCGTHGPITDDHVPPKAVFAKPRPYNLITVPSCERCRQATTKDDEYFRVRLGLNDQARGHPDVDANLPSIFRSLQRPEAIGMVRQLASDSFPVALRTASGLHVGQSSAFHVDMDRIFRVIRRTVRGLYYHETQLAVPSESDILVHCDDTLSSMSAKDLKDSMDQIIIPLSQIAPKTIGDNVFSYRYAIMEQRFVSVWALTFYGRISFLAFT